MSDFTTKVLGLLTKAESTEFPAEADALLAKAQELMSRHAIDEAMLDNARDVKTDAIGHRQFAIPSPYARQKGILLNVLATVNHCRAVQKNDGTVVVMGHESDLSNVETMFAALCLQAVRSMLNELVPVRENPRAFRNAFLLGYAGRIRERLTEAAATAAREYEAETGASTALVVVAREKAVDSHVQEQFPRLRSSSSSYSSRSGRGAGVAAANRANLGQSSVGAGRRAVGR